MVNVVPTFDLLLNDLASSLFVRAPICCVFSPFFFSFSSFVQVHGKIRCYRYIARNWTFGENKHRVSSQTDLWVKTLQKCSCEVRSKLLSCRGFLNKVLQKIGRFPCSLLQVSFPFNF